MAEQLVQADNLLPIGESIRTFLEQTYLSKTDLKAILRERGVFVEKIDKADTIPLLISTILSPKEFDTLKECQTTKEDNPKIVTRVLPWNSNKKLIETIPSSFDVNEIIKNQYKNYKVKGSPRFIPVENNPDKLSLDYEIERTNLSKSWASFKSNFPGNITIEKITDGKEVKLALTYTAAETKDLNQKIATSLKQNYKAEGYIMPESDFVKITFGSFSNEERIKFFWKLIGDNKTEILAFKDITDVDLSVDENTVLPEKMDWMQKKVRDLKFKGSELHNTPFIKDSSFHKHFLFKRLDARFDFDYSGAKGSCNISFGFPDYITKQDTSAEFEINVSSAVALDASCKHLNKNAVKNNLLKSLNNFKLAVYRDIINSRVPETLHSE
jgi:hypothetical protein